jgi:DNA-binding protein YbaB
MSENVSDSSEHWKEEIASTPPVVARSEDGAVEVEMSVDLVVRRVTLEPRATRDLDVLESLLRDVVNDALAQAREANPAQRRVQAMFAEGQADFQQTLDGMTDELRQRTAEAEMYFADIKRRIEQRRGAIRHKRG